MSDQDKEKDLADMQVQAKAEAYRHDPDLAEMGLLDPKDENWEREDPYDYMPYLV